MFNLTLFGDSSDTRVAERGREKPREKERESESE